MKNELTERSQQIKEICESKAIKYEVNEKYLRVPEGYSCFVTSYKFSEKAWAYLKVRIITPEGNEVEFYRNYPSLPYLFLTHNGMDYMITGEDYQGYTVVNLTKATVRTILHPGHEKGWGWCPVSFIDYDETDSLLTVEGCYWGAEFEYRKYIVEDFDTFNFDQFETEAEEYNDDDDDEELKDDEE